MTYNREDVQLGLDVDSKVTGQAGEWTMTLNKVYSRYEEVRQSINKGVDKRLQIITKLADPDAVGHQIERYSTSNCWVNDLPVVSYERGALVEMERRADLRRPIWSTWIASNKEEHHGRQAKQNQF